ncbi:MAG: hypothetical protein ACRDOY_01050 [Nocardioidaceae bacterium]
MSTVPQGQQSESNLSRALDLITAVAHRDAAPEDIVAQLRREGIDTLDVVVAALARASSSQATDHRRARRPIDVRSFSRPTPPEILEQIVHQAPAVPFVLNGVLYDPADIRLFDGRELHFVTGSSGQLIAFEDRNVIARAWELSLIAPLAGKLIETSKPERGDMAADFYSSGFIAWPDTDAIGAYFYEDTGPEGWGSELFLSPGYEYRDLTEVCEGFLCTSDWNDKISAFQFKHRSAPPSLVCVLCEHTQMQGSTYTSFGEFYSQLGYLGWNDRASSVVCW